MIAQDPLTIPWDKLAPPAASIVGVVVVVWLFLRYLSEQRAHEAAQRKEFTDALAVVTKNFGDRVEVMSGAVTASNARVETAMRDLAIEMRGSAHGAKK